FDPNTPNPAAGGIPGAMIFAGSGPGRSGKRVFEDPSWNVGPRFGFAYQLRQDTVVRGGYGIYYAGVAASQWTAYPTTGFQNNPTAANVTGGVFPAFYWDSTCPTGVAASVSCGFPKSDIILPPIIDPSVANGTLVVTEPKNGATQPRYQNWSLSVQHQFSENMLLDLNYVGDHGTRLVNNWTTAGVLANMLDPGVLSTYGPNLLTTSVTDPAAQAAGIKVPYPGFTGDVAQALRMWPQYQGIRYRDVPNGMSIYHALQVTFERRMTAGFQFRLAYTWSKLINNGAEAGQADQIGGQFG